MSILAFLCYLLLRIALSCAASQAPCELCLLASIGLLLVCSIHVAVNTRAKSRDRKGSGNPIVSTSTGLYRRNESVFSSGNGLFSAAPKGVKILRAAGFQL